VTDGTSAGTHEVTGVVGANATVGLNPADLAVFGDRLKHDPEKWASVFRKRSCSIKNLV
jgi:hypothetical protein